MVAHLNGIQGVTGSSPVLQTTHPERTYILDIEALYYSLKKDFAVWRAELCECGHPRGDHASDRGRCMKPFYADSPESCECRGFIRSQA